MYKVQLSNSFYECPVEWQNFIDNMYTECPELIDEDGYDNPIIDQEIIKRLAAYNCEFIETPANYIASIIFNDELDYVAFKLKFM